MNIKLKDNPDATGMLAGIALLVLALGYMVFKLWSLQGQVSNITANQNTLQTVPPSQQLTPQATERKKILDNFKSAKIAPHSDEQHHE